MDEMILGKLTLRLVFFFAFPTLPLSLSLFSAAAKGRGQVQAAGSVMGGNGKMYDARAVDVWAMGVMLYLMVAGVYVFSTLSLSLSSASLFLSETLKDQKHGERRREMTKKKIRIANSDRLFFVFVCSALHFALLLSTAEYRYPFEDPQNPDNVACTLQNVRDGRIRPLPADVSHQCADLIVRMLHKKTSKRLTLDQVLQHPWIKINGAHGSFRKLSKKSSKEITRRASDLKHQRVSNAAAAAKTNTNDFRKSSSKLLSEVDKVASARKSQGSNASRSSSKGFKGIMHRLSHLSFT